MPIWTRLKSELDRAGKAAQHAIDEGKVRLEALRARQLADKSAQALGYAVHRDHAGLQPLDDTARWRLLATLTERLEEVKRLEDQLAAARSGTATGPGGAGSAPGATP